MEKGEEKKDKRGKGKESRKNEKRKGTRGKSKKCWKVKRLRYRGSIMAAFSMLWPTLRAILKS